MSFSVVFSQMIVIFVLMMVGYLFYCRNMVSEGTAKDLSAMVVNFCSPALLISSVARKSSVTPHNLVYFLCITLVTFLVLILMGYGMSRVLRVPAGKQVSYVLMTAFGNVGFIGIPIVSALLGQDALIYVAIFNLIFNVLMYTFGVYILTKDLDKEQGGFSWKALVNPGTVASLVTLLLFLLQIPLPDAASQLLNYAGQPATLLSLFVIGMSLAQMNLKDVISDKVLFVFTLLRFIAFPVLVVVLTKQWIPDELMRGTLALMIAVPVGNLPAMMTKRYGKDDSDISRGIVYTTLLSVFTITVTCMFL